MYKRQTLYLYPLARSYNEVSQLPNDIRLYITDENNVLEDYVYGSEMCIRDSSIGKGQYYSPTCLSEWVKNLSSTFWQVSSKPI